MPRFYNLSAARSPEQLEDMLRLEAAGVCLFCPGGLGQEIVHRTGHWTVTPNKYPYAHTRHHLLLVPDQHVTDMIDLTPEAQADFWPVLAWVKKNYDLTSYGVAARSGDGRFTGSTIQHLHFHVLTGDVDDPGYQPVRVKLSSRHDEAEEARLRARVHPDQLDAGLA